jgi:predicted phage tail protein
MAALVSWAVNGKLITAFGNKAVIFIGPAVEESFKTGLAWFLGAPLIISHVVFGIAEAIWELITYKRGKLAAVFAVGSHLFYGLVTILVAGKAGILLALIVAYTVHMLWNYWVLYNLGLVASK